MDDEHFYKNISNSIDGYSTRCIKCEIGRATKRNNDNKEEYLQYLKDWHQENLEYHQNQNNQWYADNKEYRQEYTANWRKENPERVKELAKNHRDHDISTKEWNSELKVFNHRCAYCDITEKEHKQTIGEKLHKDHEYHNGYNDIRNAIPACKSCNCSKHTDDMEKWFREQSFFSEEKLVKVLWWITEGYKAYIEDKPPYRITRKRVYNNDKSYKVAFELWSVDEKRNVVECITTGDKKKDITQYIELYYKK